MVRSYSKEMPHKRIAHDISETVESQEETSSHSIERRPMDLERRHAKSLKSLRAKHATVKESSQLQEPLAASTEAPNMRSSTRNTADFTDYNPTTFPIRHLTWELEDSHLILNPATTFIAVVWLWSIALWCLLNPESSNKQMAEWRQYITRYCTWFFMGTKAVNFFFLVFLVWKFGHVRLGDEKPEFSNVSYFCLILCAGVSVGPFVYGVAEPLWHQHSNYFANEGYHSQDEVDMFAINMAVTDWALSGWAPYAIVAIAMGLAGYRFNMPMTFRSCFYPVLGEYTWGWMGDLLDGFAIVVIISGMCTNIGIGAIQIVTALQYFGWTGELLPDQVNRIQLAIVWAVTLIASVSLLAGLRKGIKYLGYLAVSSGLLLLFLVFWMDNTKFLLNLIVQEVGYYCQYSLLQLNFWTDAFGQLQPGEGRSIDGKSAEVWWMDIWMLFYEAWWVTWAAFVGMFIARISRGRTITEVALYSILIPTIYCVFWFCSWGGIGLRQSRQAMELELIGSQYFGDNATFRINGSNICYDVPQENVYYNDTLIFTNHLLGVTPVCQFDPLKANEAILNVLYSFSYPADFVVGFGPSLGVLLILSMTLYFSTSSDAASFIVDLLSTNGIVDHHWIQILFWPITQAMLATALITVGDTKALEAVQAASILAGLPYAVLLWLLMHAIYSFCVRAVDFPESDMFDHAPSSQFSMPAYGGVFNIMEYIFSFGKVNKQRLENGMDLPSKLQVVEFFKGLFVPFVSLHQILNAVYPCNVKTNVFVVTLYSILHMSWIAIFIASIQFHGLRAWCWAIYLGVGTCLSYIRNGFRTKYNIRSHVPADILLSWFLWPQILAQMRIYLVEIESVIEKNSFEKESMQQVKDRSEAR